MLTMFTKSPQPARANTYLRKKYGYSSDAYDNSDKVLHSTLSADRFTSVANTGNMLEILCQDDGIYIQSQIEVENVYWSKEALKRSFEKKYTGKFVYAKALSRGAGSSEEFHFTEAYKVYGFNYDAFIDLLGKGKIYVDLRIGQYPDGRTHDHGTGFRIRESDHALLFKSAERLV